MVEGPSAVAGATVGAVVSNRNFNDAAAVVLLKLLADTISTRNTSKASVPSFNTAVTEMMASVVVGTSTCIDTDGTVATSSSPVAGA